MSDVSGQWIFPFVLNYFWTPLRVLIRLLRKGLTCWTILYTVLGVKHPLNPGSLGWANMSLQLCSVVKCSNAKGLSTLTSRVPGLCEPQGLLCQVSQWLFPNPTISWCACTDSLPVTPLSSPHPVLRIPVTLPSLVSQLRKTKGPYLASALRQSAETLTVRLILFTFLRCPSCIPVVRYLKNVVFRIEVGIIQLFKIRW